VIDVRALWEGLRERLARRAAWHHLLAAAVLVLAHSTITAREMAGAPRYSDEQHHMKQVEQFCGGDFTPNPRITTIPGYHVLAMEYGRLTGDCTLPRIRRVNVVLMLLATAAFAWACRAAGSERVALRTLQFYFLPVLLPYAFLVYADVVSVLMNVVTAGLLLSGRPRAAGLAGSAAIVFRQTNVVWLPLVIVWVLLEDASWRDAARPWRALLARLWPTLVGLAAFAVFVKWNGGIAVGGRGAFAAGLFSGNVFLGLFLFFLLFLPASLARLWHGRARLRDPLLAWALLAGWALLLTTFAPEHPFNKFGGFLRNELLSWVRVDPFLQTLFYLPIAGAIAVLYLAPLWRPALYALYPLAILSVVPLRLVEHRYAMPAMVFFLLFRKDESTIVEASGLALAMALSTAALWVIARGVYGL
jgi:alpha-1,2-glucosyltransferase